MRQAFLLNIFLLLLVNALIKPLFIFGVDLQVQRQTIPGEYGLYFTLQSWTFLLLTLSDLGLQNYGVNQMSRHPHLFLKYFPRFLKAKLGLLLVYFVVVMAVAYWGGAYDWPALTMLAALLFNQSATQLILFFRANLTALGNYRIDSFFSVLDKLLMLVLCGGALWWYGAAEGRWFPIWYFIWSQMVALSLTLGIVGAAVWLFTPAGKALKMTATLRHTHQTILLFLRKSIPYAVLVLLMGAYTRLDVIFLERMSEGGREQAGLFAGAYRLLDALNMFGFLFAGLLLPMFGRLLGQKESVAPLTVLGLRLITAGAIALSWLVFHFRVELMEIMFNGDQIAERARVLGVLIWAFIPVSISYIFSTLLTAGTWLNAMNRWFVLAVILDIVLNITLIPNFRAEGSAWAALLTQIFVASGIVYLAGQKMRVWAPVSVWGRMLVFGLLMGVWDWATRTFADASLSVQFVTGILSAIILPFVTGLIDWKQTLETVLSLGVKNKAV